MNEKVSIIVPIYNTEKEYLERCINSITNQTYHDIQIILVDDGSKVDYGKYLDTWKHVDRRIEIYHKSNGGVASARNTGLDHVEGGMLHLSTVMTGFLIML